MGGGGVGLSGTHFYPPPSLECACERSPPGPKDWPAHTEGPASVPGHHRRVSGGARSQVVSSEDQGQETRRHAIRHRGWGRGRTSGVRERVKPRSHLAPNLPSMEPGYGRHPGLLPSGGPLRLSSCLGESLLCAQVQGAPQKLPSVERPLSSRAAVHSWPSRASCLQGQPGWGGEPRLGAGPAGATVQTLSLTRPRPRMKKTECPPPRPVLGTRLLGSAPSVLKRGCRLNKQIKINKMGQ